MQRYLKIAFCHVRSKHHRLRQLPLPSLSLGPRAGQRLHLAPTAGRPGHARAGRPWRELCLPLLPRGGTQHAPLLGAEVALPQRVGGAPVPERSAQARQREHLQHAVQREPRKVEQWEPRCGGRRLLRLPRPWPRSLLPAAVA